MSRLDIRLLGPPEVELDQKPIQVDTRKAVALLSYLAVSGQHHRRDGLAALLWPDSSQTRARAALRRTLSSLSKALGGKWLAISREMIGLQVEGEYRLDVDTFRRRLDHARASHASTHDELNAALGLYRGDFMSGFSLRDSPAFDDWQYLQAEAARRDLIWALEQLTAHCIASGDWSTGIDHANRWLTVDLLQEAAHRSLMQLYALAGNRASAVRQYRECVQILDRELGVAPLEETTAIYTAIMESRFPVLEAPPSSSTPRSPKPKDVPTFPLVGRAAERAALIDTYDAVDRSGRLIVIEGEAGIGKTRLADELVDYVRSRESVVVSSTCYAGEAELAYGVIAGLLRSGVQLFGSAEIVGRLPLHIRNEVSRLLPELVDDGSAILAQLESPGALDRFYDAIIQFLLALNAPDSPALLVVDDLQWADDASLNVLSYLIRRLHRSPLCLLMAWRSEDIERSHRLRELLSRSQRDELATLIRLGPLTHGDILELIAHIAAKRAVDFSRSLYEESEGVPLFAVEYLTHIEEEHEAGLGDWPMPDGVRDLIYSRLQAADSAGLQLLTTAAVIGRSFDFDLLRLASGRSESETVETVDHLLSRGFIRESDRPGSTDVTYDFSHEKLRALLYEETSLVRRRLIHQRVAGALERRARRSSESGRLAAQIAKHFQLAGMETEAAHYSRLAGDHARSLYGNAEALSHYRTALALGHADPAHLHEAIGDLETLNGSYAGALQSYQTAAAHGGATRLPVIEQKLGKVCHRLGDWEIAERHYESALGAFGEDQTAERAQVLADWSLTAHRRGDTPRALEIGRRALELAAESNDDATLARTYNLLGVLARNQGDAVETARHLEQSLRFAKSMPDPSARIAALNNLALVCADQAEFDQAINLTEEALELCRSQGDRHQEAALLNNLADFCHFAGDDVRSMDYLKNAVAIFAEIGQSTDTLHPEIWMLVEW